MRLLENISGRFILFICALALVVSCSTDEQDEDFSAFVGTWISTDFCGNTSEASIVIALSSRAQYDLEVTDPNNPQTMLGAIVEDNNFTIANQIYPNSFGEAVTFDGTGELRGETLAFSLTAALMEIPSSCSGSYTKQ